ncbi:MAG: hypothetical protein WDW36_001874 [Sanguina aurantia]
MLGSWEASAALQLQAVAPGQWSGEMEVAAGVAFEAKVVILASGSSQHDRWESGPNRRVLLQPPPDAASTTTSRGAAAAAQSAAPDPPLSRKQGPGPWLLRAAVPLGTDRHLTSCAQTSPKPLDQPPWLRVWTAPRVVPAMFSVPQFVTAPGQGLFLVGSSPQLGSWDPRLAAPLTWSHGHHWSGSVGMDSTAGDIEMKVICGNAAGYAWEPGPNRRIQVSDLTSARQHHSSPRTAASSTTSPAPSEPLFTCRWGQSSTAVTFVPSLTQTVTPRHQHSTAAPHSDTGESHDVASSTPSSADSGPMRSHGSNSGAADSQQDLRGGDHRAGSDPDAHGDGVSGSRLNDGPDAGLASLHSSKGLVEDTDGSSRSRRRRGQNIGSSSSSRLDTEGVPHASRDEPTRSQVLGTSSGTAGGVTVRAIAAPGRTQQASSDEIAALTSELRALRMDRTLMLCQLEAAQGQFVAKEQAMEALAQARKTAAAASLRQASAYVLVQLQEQEEVHLQRQAQQEAQHRRSLELAHTGSLTAPAPSLGTTMQSMSSPADDTTASHHTQQQQPQQQPQQQQQQQEQQQQQQAAHQQQLEQLAATFSWGLNTAKEAVALAQQEGEALAARVRVLEADIVAVRLQAEEGAKQQEQVYLGWRNANTALRNQAHRKAQSAYFALEKQGTAELQAVQADLAFALQKHGDELVRVRSLHQQDLQGKDADVAALRITVQELRTTRAVGEGRS